MSNKTQLQTNNTNLDALITRVNAAKDTAASLPEAGSGGSGGGSVETCTVTVTNPYSCYGIDVIATTVVDGVETPYVSLTPYGGGSDTHEISNVKCGSIITVLFFNSDSSVPYVETNNGAELIKACHMETDTHSHRAHLVYVFTAPTTAGVHSTIIADAQ